MTNGEMTEFIAAYVVFLWAVHHWWLYTLSNIVNGDWDDGETDGNQ